MTDEPLQWFAIKTRQDFKAEEVLAPLCSEVYFPKQTVVADGRPARVRAVIPHVLFIRTTATSALALEAKGRREPGSIVPFWIYRYPSENRVQPISERSIDLLRLLTSDDTTPCRIYTASSFSVSQRVEITGGLYKGYQGYVKRIDKNKHVLVSIEGLCMVILPYIHPDLLAPVD